MAKGEGRRVVICCFLLFVAFDRQQSTPRFSKVCLLTVYFLDGFISWYTHSTCTLAYPNVGVFPQMCFNVSK